MAQATGRAGLGFVNCFQRYNTFICSQPGLLAVIGVTVRWTGSRPLRHTEMASVRPSSIPASPNARTTWMVTARDIDREVSFDQQLSQSSQRLGDMLAATGTSPSQKVAQREQELLLAGLLDRLPEDYRNVLILRHLEGLSHDDVARRMGRQPGAVRMLWVRALARLRAEATRTGIET